MASGRILTGMALIASLAATPAFAGEGQRGRERNNDGQQRQRVERSDGQRPRGRDAAASRQRRDADGPRNVQRQVDRQRSVEVQRRVEVQRAPRVVVRPNYNYSNRGYNAYRGHYNSRRVIVPRIVTVVPYRPYVYRPRIGFGVYYGTGGAYPYGYTPRGYYDPLPGRAYGGLRITDAPHEAQVFADGYYVGIVDDFDGVFQHLNLEAGPHRIEIQIPGSDDVVDFDVVVQPGRTITYRGDW